MKCSCTKTFILTLALIWVAIGCGKKVQNTKPESDTDFTDIRALKPSSLTVEMKIEDDAALESESIYFTDNAWIVIPESEEIRIKSGAPEHYRTRIYFNVTEENSLAYNEELFCEYSTVKVYEDGSHSYKSTFVGCFDDQDSDGEFEKLSFEPGREVHQSSGTYIQFEFIYGFSKSTSEIYTDLEVADWY